MESWKKILIEELGIVVDVSNYGNVRTTDKTITIHNKYGIHEKFIPGSTKTAICNGKAGYYQFKFYNEGKSKHIYAHRLVWMAFNGSIPDGYEIDHEDCDKSNNRLSNLKLITRKNNMKKMLSLNPHIKNNLKFNKNS